MPSTTDLDELMALIAALRELAGSGQPSANRRAALARAAAHLEQLAMLLPDDLDGAGAATAH